MRQMLKNIEPAGFWQYSCTVQPTFFSKVNQISSTKFCIFSSTL